MKSAAVGALCLAVGAQAFKGTAPLLIWGNDESSESVKNVQSAISSSTVQAAEFYGRLRRLGCDWDRVAVVHVDNLHHSRVPALTLPKPDLAIPYLLQPDRSELDSSLGEWANVCGASTASAGDDVGGKVIVHYTQDGTAIALPTADFIILTSTPPPSSSPASPVGQRQKSKATLETLSNLSARLHLKPKAKRSKYVSAKRQEMDLQGLEEELKDELEVLQEELKNAKEDFGFSFEHNDEAQEGASEGVGEGEGDRKTLELERPEGIDEDSAYADAPSRPVAQQRPQDGEDDDDNDNDGEGDNGDDDDDGDNDNDNDHKGHNRTSPVDPNAPLLDRVQLFTTPLLTALLISFLIFIPVIMLGIKSLADIQVPPRMMEISRGAQVSKEKKEQ